MELKYHSGEVIRRGDRVRFAGAIAVVEEAITEPTGDPSRDWYFTENGPGALIRELSEPKTFGLLYETDPEETEDLVFVQRAD